MGENKRNERDLEIASRREMQRNLKQIRPMPETNSFNSATIEELPEKVLLHILSLLPTTLDAIQTTIISPMFRNLWTSLPCLSFDQTLFLSQETLQFFISFITRTLIHRSSHSQLRSLRLKLQFTADLHRYHSNITSYIRYAVAHNANNLTLAFHSKYIRWFASPDDDDAVYSFHFSILHNSSVEFLYLERCDLILPPIRGGTQFEALRSVHLTEIYLTDLMVSDLITGCVNLERLSMYHCRGMKDLEIVSSKLRNLTLFNFSCDEGSLRICAPILWRLYIAFFEVGNYVLEDASALVEAHVSFIHKPENYGYWSKIVRLLGHVERLHLQNWGYKVVEAKDLFCGSFSFYNLTHLDLKTMYTKSDLHGIAVLLERLPKLETMFLSRNLKIDEEEFEPAVSEEFGKINFSIPSLRKIKMDCFWGVVEDFSFLKLVMRNEVVLERIVLLPIGVMDGIESPPIVLVKQSQGLFHVLHGSFPNVEVLYT